MASDVEDKPKRCRLLELPGELRNHIFEYALSDLNIVIEAPGCKGPKAAVFTFALTMTCRQIHKECGNLVYDLNPIKLKIPQDLQRFFSQDRRQCEKLLNRVANKHKECGKLKRVEVLLKEKDNGGYLFSSLHFLASRIRSLNKADFEVLIQTSVRFHSYQECICLRFRVDTWDSIRDGIAESIEQHYGSPLDQNQIQETSDVAEDLWDFLSPSSA